MVGWVPRGIKFRVNGGPRITQILIPDLRMEFFVALAAAWKETVAIHQKEIKESLDDEKCWMSFDFCCLGSGAREDQNLRNSDVIAIKASWRFHLHDFSNRSIDVHDPGSFLLDHEALKLRGLN